MADTYYYLWEFAVSAAIIVLGLTYICYDRIKKRGRRLSEPERERRIGRLNAAVLSVLGVFATIGGGAWLLFVLTHEIYVSPELKGWHCPMVGLITAIVGIGLLAAGIRTYYGGGFNSRRHK